MKNLFRIILFSFLAVSFSVNAESLDDVIKLAGTITDQAIATAEAEAAKWTGDPKPARGGRSVRYTVLASVHPKRKKLISAIETLEKGLADQANKVVTEAHEKFRATTSSAELNAADTVAAFRTFKTNLIEGLNKLKPKPSAGFSDSIFAAFIKLVGAK